MRRPVAVTSDDGLRLVGDAYGDPEAPPVVLLHGGGQTRHAWGGTAAALAARGWYAVSMDLRGHGDSGWAADGDYRMDAFVRDLRAVAVWLGRPPVLVGASLGGFTALVAAGETTAAFAAAVVLVDIVPRTEPKGVARIIAFMTGHPNGFASLEEAAEAVAGYLHHRPKPKDLSGLRKNLRLGADGRYRWHWDPRMLSGGLRLHASTDPERMERAARSLRVPTLLVRGRMSDIVSEQGARHFLELAPHARYVDVSDAGHMVAGDRNDRFTDAVVEFLATTLVS
jgi:pimeloyl-ACP methyl ester carboxylesterase